MHNNPPRLTLAKLDELFDGMTREHLAAIKEQSMSGNGVGWSELKNRLRLACQNQPNPPTIMDRCKTCKHWAPCASMAHRENYKKAGGICSSDKIVEDRWRGYGADMMVYSYAEDGEFWTGPDFGCVHHQQVDA
jgi:hypothetical protein